MKKERIGARWTGQLQRDWTKTAVGWERFEPILLYTLSAVDPFLIRALALAPGQRVLDFACGSGEPTLAIAPLVAPGSVLGLDVSAPMLAIARRRARLRAAPNVEFRRGNITRVRLPRFDRIVSRFGLMFVEDVPATLQRLRGLLKPGGRIALAVWGPLDRNTSFRIRGEVSRPFLAEPPPDPETVPGPMRLGRPGWLARLMRDAGFTTIHTDGVHTPFTYRDEEDYFAVSFTAPGPSQALYDSLNDEQRAALRRQLTRRLRPYRSGALLRLPGLAWVVSGRRRENDAS
jgi:SAM-dependent methyltransferase